jgi:selenocysteine lyase/cysteine desulfurase
MINRFQHLLLISTCHYTPARLPIISFLIRGPADATGRSRFLHNSFVCAVLNDIFGVQVRGGCACAGPYALHLLGRALHSSTSHLKLSVEATSRPDVRKIEGTFTHELQPGRPF